MIGSFRDSDLHQISQSCHNLVEHFQSQLSDLIPKYAEDGCSSRYEDLAVNQHLESLCKELAKLQLPTKYSADLEVERRRRADSDLTEKSPDEQGLFLLRQLQEAQVELAAALESHLACCQTDAPKNEENQNFCESLYFLDSVATLAREKIQMANQYLTHCLTGNSNFKIARELSEVQGLLSESWTRATITLKTSQALLHKETRQSQGNRQISSSLIERQTPPELVNATDPLSFSTWRKTFGELIDHGVKGSSPEEINMSKLAHLKRAVKHKTAREYILYETSYDAAMQILQKKFANPQCISPRLQKAIFDLHPANSKLEESQIIRKAQNIFRQMTQLELECAHELGRHAAEHIISCLEFHHREDYERQAALYGWDDAKKFPPAKFWSNFENYLEGLLTLNQSLHNKDQLRISQTNKFNNSSNRGDRKAEDKKLTTPKFSNDLKPKDQSAKKKQPGKANKENLVCLYCQEKGSHSIFSCKLMKSQLGIKDFYYRLKQRGVCITCLGLLASQGNHQNHQCPEEYEVTDKKSGKKLKKQNACSRQCRWENSRVHWKICSCARQAQKDLLSTPSKSQLLTSNKNDIKVNNRTLGRPQRPCQSLTLVAQDGSLHCCSVLFDWGTSSSLCCPTKGRKMAMEIEDLEDKFVISTEIGDQEVEALKFRFKEQRSGLTFEAMGGAEASGVEEFQSFSVPKSLQVRWGLPPIWQNQTTAHFFTMGTDLWAKFPDVLDEFDDVVVCKSNINGEMFCFYVGNKIASEDETATSMMNQAKKAAQELKFSPGDEPWIQPELSPRPSSPLSWYELCEIDNYLDHQRDESESGSSHQQQSDIITLPIQNHSIEFPPPPRSTSVMSTVPDPIIENGDRVLSSPLPPPQPSQPGSSETPTPGRTEFANHVEPASQTSPDSPDVVVHSASHQPNVHQLITPDPAVTDGATDGEWRSSSSPPNVQVNHDLIIPGATTTYGDQRNASSPPNVQANVLMRHNSLSDGSTQSSPDGNQHYATTTTTLSPPPEPTRPLSPLTPAAAVTGGNTMTDDSLPAPSLSLQLLQQQSNGQSPVTTTDISTRFQSVEGVTDVGETRSDPSTEFQSVEGVSETRVDVSTEIQSVEGALGEQDQTLSCQHSCDCPAINQTKSLKFKTYVKSNGVGVYNEHESQFLSNQDAAWQLSLGTNVVSTECLSCSECVKCNSQHRFLTFQQQEDEKRYRQQLNYDATNQLWETDYLFQAVNGRKVEDLDDQEQMAKSRFLASEKNLLKKYSPEAIAALDQEVFGRLETQEYSLHDDITAQFPEFEGLKKYYHPLVFVAKSDSKTHKLRLCLDPSCIQKPSNTSFNDYMVFNESLHADLSDVLNQIRFSKYVAYNDIRRYFNRQKLKLRSQALSSFHWRQGGLGSGGPVVKISARFVQFGFAQSPLLSGYALRETLLRFCDEPEIKNLKTVKVYCDDIFVLENSSLSELYRKIRVVNEVLKKGNYFLSGWELPWSCVQFDNKEFQKLVTTGVPLSEILTKQFEEYQKTGTDNRVFRKHDEEEEEKEEEKGYHSPLVVKLDMQNDNVEKALGMNWSLRHDRLGPRFHFHLGKRVQGERQGQPLTLRNIDEQFQNIVLKKNSGLGLNHSIYDPFFSIFQLMLMSGKYTFKKLLLHYPTLQWRDPLPAQYVTDFKESVREILHLENYAMPRRLTPPQPHLYEDTPSLVIMVDSSQHAIAVNIYFVYQRLDAKGHYVVLYLSRSYVGGMRQESIPASEARSLQVGAKLYNTISKIDNFPKTKETIFCSDSKVTLQSLKKAPALFDKEVCQKYDQILHWTQGCRLVWVPSALNSSDGASRPGQCHNLATSRHHLQGGHLSLPRSEWRLFDVTDEKICKNISLKSIPWYLLAPPRSRVVLACSEKLIRPKANGDQVTETAEDTGTLQNTPSKRLTVKTAKLTLTDHRLQVEPFARIFCNFAYRKAIRVITYAYLFGQILKNHSSFREEMQNFAQYMSDVTEKCECDASYYSRLYLKKTTSKVNKFRPTCYTAPDGRVYIRSRLVSRYRTPSWCRYQLFLRKEASLLLSLIWQYHLDHHLAGPYAIRDKFERDYYAEPAISMFRQAQRGCHCCTRILDVRSQVKMGAISQHRLGVTENLPPFSRIFLDILGPQLLPTEVKAEEYAKILKKHKEAPHRRPEPGEEIPKQRVYCLSIVCWNTGSLALYGLTSLHTSHILLGLEAHAAIRGVPVVVASDLFSSFLSAFRQIQPNSLDDDEMITDEVLEKQGRDAQDALVSWCGHNKIYFYQPAPYSHWIFGSVERPNLPIKKMQLLHFKWKRQSVVTYGHHLCLVASWWNQRPVCVDRDSAQFMTRQDLLVGCRNRPSHLNIPEKNALSAMFFYAERERRKFYFLLTKTYVRRLLRSSKWTETKNVNFELGDVCVIADLKTANGLHHGLAIVHELIYSKRDHELRFLKLKFKYFHDVKYRYAVRHIHSVKKLVAREDSFKEFSIPDLFDLADDPEDRTVHDSDTQSDSAEEEDVDDEEYDQKQYYHRQENPPEKNTAADSAGIPTWEELASKYPQEVEAADRLLDMSSESDSDTEPPAPRQQRRHKVNTRSISFTRVPPPPPPLRPSSVLPPQWWAWDTEDEDRQPVPPRQPPAAAAAAAAPLSHLVDWAKPRQNSKNRPRKKLQGVSKNLRSNWTSSLYTYLEPVKSVMNLILKLLIMWVLVQHLVRPAEACLPQQDEGECSNRLRYNLEHLSHSYDSFRRAVDSLHNVNLGTEKNIRRKHSLSTFLNNPVWLLSKEEVEQERQAGKIDTTPTSYASVIDLCLVHAMGPVEFSVSERYQVASFLKEHELDYIGLAVRAVSNTQLTWARSGTLSHHSALKVIRDASDSVNKRAILKYLKYSVNLEGTEDVSVLPLTIDTTDWITFPCTPLDDNTKEWLLLGNRASDILIRHNNYTAEDTQFKKVLNLSEKIMTSTDSSCQKQGTTIQLLDILFTPLNTEAQMSSNFASKSLEIQRFNSLISNLSITSSQLRRAETLIQQSIPSYGWKYLFSEDYYTGLREGKFLEVTLLIVCLVISTTICVCCKCALDCTFKFCCPPLKYLIWCLLFPFKKCIDSYSENDTETRRWPKFRNPFRRNPPPQIQTRAMQLSNTSVQPRRFEVTLSQPRSRFNNITEL